MSDTELQRGKPLVSVVMPTFNSSAYVSTAIQSVLDQDFLDWELLVVDDGSTDDTVNIVRKFASIDGRIRLICLGENQGAAKSRNHAIDLSIGRYIAFLDSDDFWHPDKLKEQLKAFSSTGAVMIFSGFDVVKGDEKKVVRSVRAPGRVTYADLCRSNPIGCLTAIYDTLAVGKIFMPEIRMRQDWGLWLRVLKEGSFAVGLPISLATLRLHSNSLSSNKLKAIYYNYLLLRTETNMGMIRSLHGVVINLVRAIRFRKS